VKILFVLHDTVLSGATITLLRYISWLKNSTICETHFLLPYHSSSDDHYKNLGKVFYWLDENKITSNTMIGLVFIKINNYFKSKDWKQKLIDTLCKEEYDIIYGNTIVTENTLKDLKCLNKPIIWHIHENELSVQLYNPNGLRSYHLANKIIATSVYTHDYLVNNWSIPANSIKIHIPPISKNTNQQNIVDLTDDLFIIGSSGSNIVQKGMSIFITLAKILEAKLGNNNFFYVWIGSEQNEPNIRFDLEQTKLNTKFIFTGLIQNPYDYYRKIDLFVSCSREESFGLSMAECASLNIPFLCFPTNGLLQYFDNKKDYSVDYLDLNKMADRIIELYNNEAKRISLGDNAGSVCRKFDIEYLGPDWYETLQNVTKI
jgi:glycosyltransferase involved in cell wall biosynthesis